MSIMQPSKFIMLVSVAMLSSVLSLLSPVSFVPLFPTLMSMFTVLSAAVPSLVPSVTVSPSMSPLQLSVATMLLLVPILYYI